MTVPCTALGVLVTLMSLTASCVVAQAAPARQPPPPVAGIVLDATTKAPVAGATVMAGDHRAVTGDDGRFTLAVPGGPTTLEVAADGYFPLTTPVDAAQAAASDLELRLAPRTGVTDAVVVRGTAIAEAPASRTVESVEVLRTAGALDNVFRTLNTLPGVSATIEIGGYLSVRGGAPDQNLTVLDGVEVHDPYRLYGLASAFNPETVQRFDLATGGFSAKYGDRLSSMLTIETRDGAEARRLGGSASMSATDANVVVEGGMPKGAWLLTGRRTYYDLVADLVSDQSFPGFTDVQGKATWRWPSSRTLTLFALSSRQGGEVTLDDDEANVSAYDDTDNDFGWARLGTTLGQHGHAMVVAAFSDTRVLSGFDLSTADDGRRSNAPGPSTSRRAELTFDTQLRVRDLSLRQETGWAVGRHTLGTGLEVHRLTTQLDFLLTGDRNPNAANGSSLQGGAGLPEDLRSRLEQTRAATWLEGTWTLGDRLSARTGLRLDRVGLTGETLLSPRLSATWGLAASTRVRAAAGLYTQSPGYEKLVQGDYLLDLSDAAARGVRSQQARLASVGLEHDLPGSASVRVEGYYKRFDDVLVGQLETDADRAARLARYDFPAALAASVPATPLITSVPGNDGRGRAYGLDVQVTRLTGSRLRGWANYTWSKADRDAYGRRYPFEYDRRHAATVVSSYRLTRRWELAATARVASGFPRTAPLGLRVAGMEDVTDVDGDGATDEIVPERDGAGRLVYTADFGGLDNLQRGRLPFFARLDARLTWRTASGRWEAYGEVLNVLNRRNAGVLTPVLEHDPAGDQPRLTERRDQWIPLLPTIGMRFRF